MWPTLLRLKASPFMKSRWLRSHWKSVWTLFHLLPSFSPPHHSPSAFESLNSQEASPSIVLAFDLKHLQRNEAIGHGAQIHEGSNPFIHVNDFGIVDLAFPWWHGEVCKVCFVKVCARLGGKVSRTSSSSSLSSPSPIIISKYIVLYICISLSCIKLDYVHVSLYQCQQKGATMLWMHMRWLKCDWCFTFTTSQRHWYT